MIHEYGKAVVEERVRPRQLAELSRYVRLEYGDDTTAWFILANGAEGKRGSARRQKGRLQYLLRSFRTLFMRRGQGGRHAGPQDSEQTLL